jgi:flagellar biosynthesis protein FlhG
MSHEDQASKLREMMQRMRQSQTVAIVSGKGGVGKSNVALNLAVLLSAAGNRAALVDADLGLANLDVLLAPPRGVKATAAGAAAISHAIEG